MTEPEWLTCTEPRPMLEFLQGKASDRKFRLFAVACCRRVWHLLVAQGSRTAVKVAERYADGHMSPRRLSTVEVTAQLLPGPVVVYDVASSGQTLAARAAAAVAAPDAGPAAFRCADDTAEACGVECSRQRGVPADEVSAAEQKAQCDLLRDLFGPLPFCAVQLDPAWLTGAASAVRRLAEAIYDQRAFARLPILADALEDAGCDNAAILAHCRQGGEHVRGCWAVDLLLGKESRR